MLRWIATLVVTTQSFALAQGPTSTHEPPAHYNAWVGGASPIRQQYESELLQLLIGISEEKYGPAILHISTQNMSNFRARRRLIEGKSIHVHASSIFADDPERDKFIVLPHRILKGLLGYRHLLIRPEDREKFSKINSVEEFKQLYVGQGHAWTDIKIYKHNQVPVVGSDRFDNLFPMLHKNRFDYIALGVNESTESIQDLPHAIKPEVVENLVIFYEWSVNWHIAPKRDDLAQRLDYAMETIRNNGQFDEIFNRYFAEAIKRLALPELKVIMLSLPGSYIEGATPALLLDDAEFLQ